MLRQARAIRGGFRCPPRDMCRSEAADGTLTPLQQAFGSAYTQAVYARRERGYGKREVVEAGLHRAVRARKYGATQHIYQLNL